MARMTRAAAAKANGSTLASTDSPQLSSPPATPLPNQTKKASRSSAKSTAPASNKSLQPATPASNRKRKVIKQEHGDNDDLPHNLGQAPPTPGSDEHHETHKAKPPKRAKRVKQEEPLEGPDVKAELDEGMPKAEETPKKTPKKPNYGLTPGQSPYPDYERPTSEECYEVKRLLERVHGRVEAPKAIPPPSLDVAGCGEVPSVLDALVRTRLSANTTNKNSSTAFQGLVARFGTIKEGVGKGSVDWNAVRQAPQREVFKAIERGGLAQIKSKDIQAILQMVYEENQERKDALMDRKDAPVGAEREPEAEKQDEVAKAKQHIISLDHVHLLSTNDAINKLLSYPGIGPKTASCVALFCLQRPSFAVDTHVFRLCQYLGWVPKSAKKGQPKVDRNTTYSHCDVRIPDELKYSLHYLFVKHGKVCPRCRAATGTSSANWEEGCPIEHLVRRHGQKKGGVSVAARKKAKAAAGGFEDEEESNDDLSDGAE
ncbi:putative DNA glycosylase [Teratosphaeria destructans]|uniref:DNA glycosylase n=1 Tax=Teratosphaeria destructans TaxID=418781 RepID=A0A9W7W113_9PEZI|nr:putative DNA glycosylase [Teratosphaeria destructans]